MSDIELAKSGRGVSDLTPGLYYSRAVCSSNRSIASNSTVVAWNSSSGLIVSGCATPPEWLSLVGAYAAKKVIVRGVCKPFDPAYLS